jgi:hypothetical protein
MKSELKVKTGIELIADERREQIEKHGRTVERDVMENQCNQLPLAALMLLSVEYEEGIDSASFPEGWDEELCQKMISSDYQKRLIIAGALIAAEIDRFQHD